MNNYVLVKITGKDVKRFTMSLYKKGINFYKIKYSNKSVYLKNILSRLSKINGY